MNEGCIDVMGGVLFYENGVDGEPIVLIHGNYNDHQIWEEQMRELSDTHHLISYDLRGYGHSDTPRFSFSHVEDLKLLMSTLGLEKATLVGSSMGGSVAIDFTLAYPERVHRLILAAPSVNGRSYPAGILWQGIKQHLQVRMHGHEKTMKHLSPIRFGTIFSPLHVEQFLL